MKKRVCSLGAIALMAGLAVSSSAWAADFPETEANDTKGAANAAGPLVPGDTISGNSTGASTTVAGAASADNFLLTVAAPPSSGIWRYRMVISTTGTAGHIGTLRGLTAGAGAVNAGTDATIQTTSTTTTPARFNQWYGLGGGQTQVFYRVAGAAATTDNYVSTLERTAVTPVDVVGSVAPGTVLIRPDVASQNAYDTDFWVYDSNFDPIPQGGRDDPDGTGVVVSLSPGTYYVGIGNFNTANNQANSLAADFLTGGVMDFGRVVAGASSTAGTGAVNMGIEILDGGGTSVLATGSDAPLGGAATAFDVRWFRMVVAVPTGPTLSNCLVSPNQVSAGGSVTFTSTAALGTGGGTITSVTADLTTLGGGAAVPMTPLGGNNFSLNHNIPGGQGTGSFPVTMTATDSNNLTGSCNVNVQVLGANDLCAGASVVSVGTTAGDNAAATTDGTSSCTTSSKDLWYSFTSVSGGSFVIDTEGSTQGDTVLNVFDVCGGTELACDDDGGTGLLSSLLISLTPNQTIIIRVASFGGAPAGGPFNLNINSAVSGACCNDLTGACTLVTNGICATGATYQGDNTVCAPSPCPASGSCCDPAGGTCLLRIQAQCASPSVWTSGEVCTPNPCPQPPPPANDLCMDAISIPSPGTPAVTGNNATATTDGTASCQTSSNKDLWYTFTAPAAGSYQMDTEGSTQGDTVLNVFDGCFGTELACDDDGGTGLLSNLLINLTANQTVTIRLASFGAAPAGGAFNININSVITGACCNDLTGACTLVVNAACATGTTYQGDNTVCSPSPCPASGSCCDVGSGVCLLRVQAQCNSPSVWTSGEVCTPNPCPQPPPPSNDTCATAIVVNGNNTGSAATQFAQNENDEPGGSCNTTTPAGIDNSVWFTFNSSTGGQLTGTVDTTNYDGVAVLFTGSCGAGTLVEVACWDEPDNPMDLSLPESGSSVLSPNTNYFLVVGDWGVADGGGALTWDITVPGTSGGNGRCCIGARCAIVASSACLGAGSAGASFTPSVNDCNASGVFNTPCCFADYNHAGGVTVQDIFDFLTDWFSGSINANVSGDGIAAPTVQDIFDFLTAWFSGC